MEAYISEFEKVFGFTPNCVPCTFSKDFNRLVRYYSKPKKNEKMAYKLKHKHGTDILRYEKNGRKYRRLGRLADNDFFAEFLKYGTEEELEKRKAMFNALPEEKPDFDVSTAKKDDLIAYANEKGIDLGEATKVAEIREVIENYEKQ